MADEGKDSVVIADLKISPLVQHAKSLQFPVSGPMSSSPYPAATMIQCFETSLSRVFDKLPRNIVMAWWFSAFQFFYGSFYFPCLSTGKLPGISAKQICSILTPYIEYFFRVLTRFDHSCCSSADWLPYNLSLYLTFAIWWHNYLDFLFLLCFG